MFLIKTAVKKLSFLDWLKWPNLNIKLMRVPGNLFLHFCCKILFVAFFGLSLKDHVYQTVQY